MFTNLSHFYTSIHRHIIFNKFSHHYAYGLQQPSLSITRSIRRSKGFCIGSRLICVECSFTALFSLMVTHVWTILV